MRLWPCIQSNDLVTFSSHYANGFKRNFNFLLFDPTCPLTAHFEVVKCASNDAQTRLLNYYKMSFISLKRDRGLLLKHTNFKHLWVKQTNSIPIFSSAHLIYTVNSSSVNWRWNRLQLINFNRIFSLR